MKPEKIRKITGRKIKEIKKLAGSVNNSFDQDAIYQFRMAVKSLRTFLRLLSMCYDDPKPKITRKFKRLYHIAGAIRDANIELEMLIAEKAELPIYTAKLEKDIERRKNEWELLYNENIFRKMKKKLTSYPYKALSPAAFIGFCEVKISNMKKPGKKKPATNAHIHSIRKHAKDILLAVSIARKEYRAAYKQLMHLPLARLDRMAAIIGDYNDARLQVEHLNSFASPVMGKAEISTIRKIVKKEGTKLSRERKQIMNTIKGISQQHKSP